MIFCTKCGTAIGSGDQYCTNCGTPVAQMQISGMPANFENSVQNSQAATNISNEKTTATEETTELTDSTTDVNMQGSGNDAKTRGLSTGDIPNQDRAAVTAVKIDKERVETTVTQTKKHAKNYWDWLVNSIKQPFDYSQTSHPLYGISTLVILSLISALLLLVVGRQTFTVLSGRFSMIMENPFNLGMYLKFLAIFIILFALMGIIGILITQFLGRKDQSIPWFDYTNRLGHFVGYVMVLEVVALGMLFLFGPELVNEVTTISDVIFRALLIIALGGLNLGFIATFFKKRNRFAIDRIYVAILAEAVLFITLYLGVKHMLMYTLQQVLS